MEFNNDYKNLEVESNECTARGACSVSPNISALKEAAMFYICRISYYIKELESHGAKNKSIKFNIINDLAALVSINEFSEEQLYSMIMNEYYLLKDTVKTYKKLSEVNKFSPSLLRPNSELNDNSSISAVIAFGEKLFLDKYNNLTSSKRNLIEIFEITIKCAAVNLAGLNELGTFNVEACQLLLNSLDLLSKSRISENKISKYIVELGICNFRLQELICTVLFDKFGRVQPAEVSHSTRKGKAILVSGNNFETLYNLLTSVKNMDIDVYTHSNLLLAHALKKFKEFPHLIGHYGDKTENWIPDFSTFHGAILLTKNISKISGYLYRGRLFSNDYLTPKGVIKIENEDYSSLIKSAQNSKGFSRGRTKHSSPLGFDESEIIQAFNILSGKLKSGKISRLYITGINPYSEIQRLYLKSLFSSLNKNEEVIDFSGSAPTGENILNINIGNYPPLMAYFAGKIISSIDITNPDIYFFFSTCDVLTVSNVIYLSHIGAQNIYMADCSPMALNPAIFSRFKILYNINSCTNAENDLKAVRNKKRHS